MAVTGAGAGRRGITVALAATLLMGAACSRSAGEPLGFGPSDVASVELYVYPYGAEGLAANHVEVHDRREIADWTMYFDYLPLTAGDEDREMLIGQEVAGFRFHTHDQDVFEISQVFIGKHALIVEADGTRSITPFGSPFGDLPGATVVDVT